MKRRNFIHHTALASLGLTFIPGCLSAKKDVPAFMKDRASSFARDPRGTTLEWFRNARFGMFIHYGLYSLLGRHEWVQYREKIPVAEYAKLKDIFTAGKFDASFITDLALEAGMKYINITTRHHDSFCLWDTQYSDFKSTNSPANRDLVSELYTQCEQKGLGLFFYYSHGRDWKHPHAPNNDKWGGRARPEYDPPDPSYKYGNEHDLNIYIEFVSNQIRELLTLFPNVAGIWLDGISTPKSGDWLKFQCQELYDMIHSMHPHTLVSYKQGLLGTEDFLAPERLFNSDEKPDKPLEICDTMQPRGWGYIKEDDGKHKTADDIVEMLKHASQYPANLLLNTGPLPEGDIHPEDVKCFREIGNKIRETGWDELLRS